MPRKRIDPPRPPSVRLERLRERLVQELRNPSEEGEPLILEEGGNGVRPVHLFVVWEEWADLDQEERSEIIMDAYVIAEGDEKSYLVTVAMGLTRDEAKRMKLIREQV